MKWMLFCLFITLILMMLNFLFFFFDYNDESSSPFECGIDPISEVKSPLYMHFLYIAILFLVFDVELALSIPLIFSMVSESVWNFYWMIFLLILFMGLAVEIFLGTVDWKE